jgi:hypothetical protein
MTLFLLTGLLRVWLDTVSDVSAHTPVRGGRLGEPSINARVMKRGPARELGTDADVKP